MKKIFTILIVVLLTSGVFAQSPEKMSYQAVIRDAGNALVSNTTVRMQISILKGSVSGSVVYSEEQKPTTNSNGLVSIEIGGATGFSNIDWANGPYFIKTETDPTGGTAYTIMGTSELLSVPYALYAKNGLTPTQAINLANTSGYNTGDQDLSGKVDKVIGKGLSTNDYTNAEKIKLSGLNNADGTETKVIAGTNVTVTGSGTSDSPYVISVPSVGLSFNQPTVTTQTASNVEITTATLNGVANANNLTTTVAFEWWVTTTSSTPATPSTITGSVNISESAAITGLRGNTTYSYRIYASNAVNAISGNIINFTTKMPLIATLTTSTATNIKGNSANAGGSVTDNGGSTITAQGLCWSTSVTPTTANSFTTAFTDAMTGLSPNTLYYVRAYATNSVGTAYGNQISFNSGKLIGSTAVGGLVFYNDGTGHGLVCAPSDQSAGAAWGCWGMVIGGTSTAINTGAANTNTIVTYCTTAGIASKICYDLVLNTYSDWYLPSKSELNLMFVNLQTQGLGSFSPNIYWSSSEYDNNFTHTQTFNNGSEYISGKNYTYYVRAVRTF